ncbi:response regulator [Cohnella xylanilytica]|uniref:Response regulator n=1 Tax=Cohnella xylanilytica TaxID=557555 RepID=A0A841TW16_9BACL|nr:response regulator [Cohnella xylanilytica]MBB6689784.1 response regulator [Cohnella xylanilytica]
MRKVLVVDDEKWIRRGLIQLIPWERFGLELAGEAADGQDGYELALAVKPDLLFLDMRMPGLEGKELLGKLHRELPELITIVVSGYSDFEYTKEAIRHRAFDYLLKPVKKEELAAVLEKAIAELELRAERRSSASGTGGAEGDWLRGALTKRAGGEAADEGEAKPPADWIEGECVVFVAQEDAFRDEAPDGAVLAEAVRGRLAQSRAFHFGGGWSFALTPGPDGRAELVGAIGSRRLLAGELDRLLAEIRACLGESAGAECSLGASRAASLLPRDLQAACRAAREALGSRRLNEAGRLVLAGGDARPGAADLPPYPQDREAALLLALQMGGEQAVYEQFRQFLAAIASDEATVEGMQRSAAMLVHSIEKQLQRSGASLENACGRSPLAYSELLRQRNDRASAGELFEREILPGALAQGSRAGGKQGERLVREVQRLVEAHYDQALSIQQIAESRFVNADYLSRLFKKTTGHTFVDYLTDYRIHKSIELMKVPAYKNYEIARMVGYDDYRYFSQIFKKKTGKTIGEYRGRTECASP